jgi:hypothetical protein
VSLVVFAVSASAAAARGWDPPVRVSAPTVLDILAPMIGYSSRGEAAIGFNVQDADYVPHATAWVALRSPGRSPRTAQQVPRALEVLDLAYAGDTLELLTGTSPHGRSCCFSAQLTRRAPGSGFGRPRTLIEGLTGAPTGRLLALSDGRMLALVATGHGVWVAQATGTGRFGRAVALSTTGAKPQAVTAAALPDGRYVVAWTEEDGGRLSVAAGAPGQLPHGSRTAVVTPSGHRISELALAAGAPPARRSPASASLAWIEGWTDAAGRYRSRVMVQQLAPGAAPSALSGERRFASGLKLSGDARGDQLIAWKACGAGCVVYAASRRAGGGFGAAFRLAEIDASETPQVSVGPDGAALAGWVTAGRVVVTVRAARGGGFGPGRTLSRGLASNLALASGPAGEALAVWTQGTLAPQLDVAVYRGP